MDYFSPGVIFSGDKLILYYADHADQSVDDWDTVRDILEEKEEDEVVKLGNILYALDMAWLNEELDYDTYNCIPTTLSRIHPEYNKTNGYIIEFEFKKEE